MLLLRVQEISARQSGFTIYFFIIKVESAQHAISLNFS